MQEYVIKIWHLISVSLNIKRAPPIKAPLSMSPCASFEREFVCLAGVSVIGIVIVSSFERHMRVGYTQSERANESKESFVRNRQQEGRREKN